MRRALGMAVVAVVLVLSGATADAADTDPVPSGTVSVDGQDVPILGSFSYHQRNKDTNPEIRGLVHGVRRVDGGTVLYYSIGWNGTDPFQGGFAFKDSMHPYKILHGTDFSLVDAAGLTLYHPLASDEATFTTYAPDLDSESGELRVGWAMFPELPADVSAVEIIAPYGTAAGSVPVEDGALEPVGTDPAPYVGEGWPALPKASETAAANPDAFTYTLVRRSGDVAGTALVEESPEAVAVTLDANVLFASGSAELTPQAADTLTAIADDIAARGTGEVVVTGHTDSDGSDSFNQTLSEQRAASVLAVLQPRSGSAVTFVAVGKGESEPVADNATDEGKQANRRVTVVYGVKGDS
ncbi:OmpA family protein [Cellulomonas sp.]|uniref:OmpA family protein n=1 Tax=Cellulomonas sp. TaxID=40001 RepID=UPI003BAAA7D9